MLVFEAQEFIRDYIITELEMMVGNGEYDDDLYIGLLDSGELLGYIDRTETELYLDKFRTPKPIGVVEVEEC